MIGGFYDRFAAGWDEAELDWFEALIEEQDVDIMGWAIGTIAGAGALAGADDGADAGARLCGDPAVRRSPLFVIPAKCTRRLRLHPLRLRGSG